MAIELLKDTPFNQQRTEYRTGTDLFDWSTYTLVDDVPILRTGDRVQAASDLGNRIIYWRYGNSSETRIIQGVLEDRRIDIGAVYNGTVSESMIEACLSDDYRFIWVQGPS